MDDGTLATITLTNPGGNVMGVRYEVIHSRRGVEIPKPHVMRSRRENESGQGIHAFARLMVHVPDVAHRTVAIADMARSRRSDDSFSGAGLGTNYEIVV